MTTPLYCECESPVFDCDHDAGCRRCGQPIDFTPNGDHVLIVGEATISIDHEAWGVDDPIPWRYVARRKGEHIGSGWAGTRNEAIQYGCDYLAGVSE